jgi:hypothetical protein
MKDIECVMRWKEELMENSGLFYKRELVALRLKSSIPVSDCEKRQGQMALPFRFV